MKEMKKLVLNGVEYTITDGAAVSFAQEQALTEAQMARARQNMGAASEQDVGDIETALDSILTLQNALIGGESA